jgi:hypothetical protein
MAAVFVLSAPATALAAVWNVSTCLDDGSTGSLRWAASGAVSGDTIDMTGLSSSSTTGCFATTQGGFTVALPIYNGQLNVAGGVTINGPNASARTLAVSGLSDVPASRLFASSGDLTINNLGVKYGGGNTASTGGCIRATDDITLTNVDAYKCYTYSNAGSARGGAIYSTFGSVTMTHSTVSYSSATSVSGSVRGGSVYGYTGVTLNSTDILSSTATTATGSAEGGGAFDFGNGGGGVALYNSYVKGTASVTGAGGHAYGGAVENRGTGTTYLHDSFVEGTATTQSAGKASGGAIYSNGSTELYSSSAERGSAYSKSGNAYGGNVFTKGSASLLYSSIQLGSAKRGGGVYSNAGFTSKYSVVHDNSASSGGGGVINRTAGNSLVRGTTVDYNSGVGYSGLDLFAGGATTITIENSTIVHNTGTVGPGALYLRSYHTTLDNTTVAYNSSGSGSSAVNVGGGNAGSTFDMHSTLIASNASGSGRNDLFVSSSSPFTASSNHDFVRDPGSGVPSGTIVGACPLLRQVYFAGYPWAFFMQRPASKSPVIDAGSNPDDLTADQRGGSVSATTPARASGPGPNNASPIPDIGAYEVDQDDVIYNSSFEGC